MHATLVLGWVALAYSGASVQSSSKEHEGLGRSEAPAAPPGVNLQVQLWYRDPLSTSNQTTSLSDAIDVPVFP